jgi:uncharacterized protein (TIGR02145 family)
MVVYNTNTTTGTWIYVWNGEAWTTFISGGEGGGGNDHVCGTPFVDLRDYNLYHTGYFGDAGCWMTQNLRYVPGAGYTHSPTASSALTNKYYAFPRLTNNGSYPGSSTLADIQTAWQGSADLKNMGVFYNWAAATNGQNTSTSDQGHGRSNEGPATYIQGVCPADWHLPSDREWNELEAAIAQSAGITLTENEQKATDWRGTHGKKMKSRTYINSTDPDGTSDTAANGGFDVLLVGYMLSGNGSYYFGTATFFWSSSSYSGSGAWYRRLESSNSGVSRYSNSKSNLHGVRCKKND